MNINLSSRTNIKKILLLCILGILIVLFANPVFATFQDNLESEAIDTVFQGASQSIIEQLPDSISGPMSSVVNFLENFRVQQYEGALVKRVTLEVEYSESAENDVDNTDQEQSASYADAIPSVSFDIVLYKMQYTGWSIVIILFKYWILFYFISILFAVALVGKLYGFFVRK